MGKMKYTCFLLIIIFLCSCICEKKKQASLSDIIIENSLQDLEESIANADTKTSQYTFTIQNGKYINLNDLSYFLVAPSIKSLELSGGSYSDLYPLSMLYDLEELSIDFNYNITDISPIGSLSKLKRLELSLLDSLKIITPIKSLVGLENLTIYNCYNIESIEAISSLVNLKYLGIIYNDKYYKELVPLKQLEVLTIFNNVRERMDVSYIAQLYTLRELEIQSPTYHSEDRLVNINQLRNLVNLEKLTISYLDSVDLSWITSLQKLKELRLHYCNIDDLRPLLELPNLEEVDLNISKVKDIAPLLESKSLKKIYGPIVLENNKGLYGLFKEKGIEFYPHISDR